MKLPPIMSSKFQIEMPNLHNIKLNRRTFKLPINWDGLGLDTWSQYQVGGITKIITIVKLHNSIQIIIQITEWKQCKSGVDDKARGVSHMFMIMLLTLQYLKVEKGEKWRKCIERCNTQIFYSLINAEWSYACKESTQRRQPPSCMRSKPLLISSSVILCVIYSSTLISCSCTIECQWCYFSLRFYVKNKMINKSLIHTNS